VNLAQLVEEAAADGNFEAQSQGKSVSFHATSSVILGNADPHALRSACENIIRNAVRFTSLGSDVRVLLDVDRSTPQAKAVVIVRDHGPGVPEDSLQAIFQPFYRINRDVEGPTGNGLGLAIASEAIRLHRGTISATNLRPTGLEITIQVPIELDVAIFGYELSQVDHRAPM
jgi:signal transduction histidine kinase